jgi:TonB family protein
MSENRNISSLFDRLGNLTREALECYLRGELSDEQKARIEQYLEDSPFEQEALEGLKKQLNQNLHIELEELDDRITAKTREKARIQQPHRIKPYYWAAAAGLVALVGLTVLLVFMFRSPSEKQLTVDSRQLTVENPEQSAVSGQRSAVSGQPSAVNGQPSAVSGQRSAVSGQPSAVSGQRSAVSSPETLTVDNRQLTIDNSQPVGDIAVVEDDAVISEDIRPVEVANNMEMENEDADVSKDIETQQMDEGQALNEVVVTQKGTGSSKKAMEEHYQISGNANALPREDTTAEETQIFIVVESMPEFPGGDKALYKYLADSLHYPRAAIENNIQGRVFVTFIIEKDGSISNVRVLRGIGGGCDEEALRVVQNMPKWIPGKQRGKPVRVQYNLPIKFSL